jgi:hypothetical protein
MAKNSASGDALIIRPYARTFFKCVHSEVKEYFGEKFNSSLWIECDQDGNTLDYNMDGMIDTRSLLCKIPEGHDNIVISTLSEDCLNL